MKINDRKLHVLLIMGNFHQSVMISSKTNQGTKFVQQRFLRLYGKHQKSEIRKYYKKFRKFVESDSLRCNSIKQNEFLIRSLVRFNTVFYFKTLSY